MTMTRKEAPFNPGTPIIPEGLLGTWAGQDGDGLLFMMLEEGGRITIVYDSPDAVEQTGKFTVLGNQFMAELQDGARLTLQFRFTEDTLIFAREEEGETITFTRYHEALPTVPPNNQAR